jgi:hypothetical protein
VIDINPATPDNPPHISPGKRGPFVKDRERPLKVGEIFRSS